MPTAATLVSVKEVPFEALHPADPRRLHADVEAFVNDYQDPHGHKPTVEEAVLLLDCSIALVEKLRDNGAIPAVVELVQPRRGAELLERTRPNAEYWLKHGRDTADRNDAVLCVEQAHNAYRNAAYALAEQLVNEREAHAKTAQMLAERERELEQESDIRADRETALQLIAEGLGVAYEPHQTFFERLQDAARAPRRIPPGWIIEAREDRIVVAHPQLGSYAAGFDPDNIASTVLHRFAEALLADDSIVPSKPSRPHIYCSRCEAIKPLLVDEMAGRDVTATFEKPTDLICGECRLVIATTYAAPKAGAAT